MSTLLEPRRLAFCITDLDPGGAERALVQLVTRLERRRWQPKVFCLSAGGSLVEELTNADIPVTCFGARNRRNVSVIPRLTREFRRFRPALLQTFLFHANIAGRIAGRLAKVPKIVSGIRVAERRSRLPLWIDRMTEGLVDRHVCVSRDVAEFSIEHGGLSALKITVIPNGVEFRRFADATPGNLSEFGIPPGSTTVLFVGRLDPQKDPFGLLAAVEGLFGVHKQLHVLFVGDGLLKDPLETWVVDHHLEAHIHFAGWRSDVANLMKAADCLVLPSRWEGLPNVVLEAMAAGLPVIATEVEGTSELIRHHETGLLVPPQSPEDLAGALALVLANPDQARVLGRTAQDVVNKSFTWDKFAENHASLYTALLEA